MAKSKVAAVPIFIGNTHTLQAAAFLAEVLPQHDQPANIKMQAEIIRQLAGLRDAIANFARPTVAIESTTLSLSQRQIKESEEN